MKMEIKYWCNCFRNSVSIKITKSLIFSFMFLKKPCSGKKSTFYQLKEKYLFSQESEMYLWESYFPNFMEKYLLSRSLYSPKERYVESLKLLMFLWKDGDAFYYLNKRYQFYLHDQVQSVLQSKMCQLPIFWNRLS